MSKFNKNLIAISSIMTFALGLVGPATTLAATATAPSLGSATSFSVLGAAAMSSANVTTISGDLGLSPGLGTSKTGTWTHTGGADYFGTGGLSQSAQAAALGAFTNLGLQTTSGGWGTNPWSPLPGVWTDASSPVFAGTINLNGGYNDVWVFQISTDFTFTGNVVLQGNAQACNVFWRVAGDATIGTGSNFVGTLIAQNNITSSSGSTINGRLISLGGTFIAMNGSNSSITGPTCVAAPVVAGGSSDVKIPPEPPRLTVIKHVINDNAGKAVASDFSVSVKIYGNDVSGSPAPGQATGKIYQLAQTGTTTVSEITKPGYASSFSGDCDSSGKVFLDYSDVKVCIITNDDIGTPVAVPPVPPLIDLVKVPNPLALPAGPGSVTYTYTLRNIGTVPVTNVALVGDTCSPIVLVSGDTNGDSKLDVNETWVHTCSTTLSATHTNTVVATGWANGLQATDIANATVVVGVPVVPPLIHVTKVPSTFRLLSGGGFVTYTERITNPGTVALNNVRLADDKCSPMNYISGDTNGNAKLDTNETWTYTCRTYLAKNTINTAIASGQANGLTVRDYAVATVIVAAPKLPNTGFPPENTNSTRNIAILVGLLGASVLSHFVLKKQTV